MKANGVIEVLAELFAVRALFRHIRSENSPEFIAEAIGRWLDSAGVQTLDIQPGGPSQNG